jgi:hypothetical protein
MAQAPTKYELAINIKKALDLEMLAQVARRADSNKRTDVACWPRPCENSTRYNRTRNFEACGHAQSKKIQKFLFRSALQPNQISFSHGLDPLRKSAMPFDIID